MFSGRSKGFQVRLIGRYVTKYYISHYAGGYHSLLHDKLGGWYEGIVSTDIPHWQWVLNTEYDELYENNLNDPKIKQCGE